ncbi:MAG TPA: site-2 protease family protein [Azospirillaceae bacterium]|nr:site-2 protease family protein [Azospirillaceae bacterium]
MFAHSIELFRLFGFSIRVDVSWLLLAVLITWSLAVGYFPVDAPGLDRATYWWMGAAGLIGLATSIVLHELAHALVARRYHLPIRSITLFIFGGVADLREEPPSAKAEFMVAVAGPVLSLTLSVLLALATAVAASAETPYAAVAVTGYLSMINLMLGVFNLVPAFPLDGGRMLRAALWGWKKDLLWATRIASGLGSGFGFLLILMGLYSVLAGDLLTGLWWFLIGLFVRAASAGAYQQTLARSLFAGQPVSRFMRRDPVAVEARLPLGGFVDDYVFHHYYKSFPVLDSGRLVGCVRVEDVKKVSRDRWPVVRVREVMEPCGDTNTISPDLDAGRALARMRETGASRLIVARDGRLVGIVSLKDLLGFLSLSLDLGTEPHRPGPWESGHLRHG